MMKPQEYYDKIGNKIAEAIESGNPTQEKALLREAFHYLHEDALGIQRDLNKTIEEEERKKREKRDVSKYQGCALIGTVLVMAGLIYFVGSYLPQHFQEREILNNGKTAVVMKSLDGICQMDGKYTIQIEPGQLEQYIKSYFWTH